MEHHPGYVVVDRDDLDPSGYSMASDTFTDGSVSDCWENALDWAEHRQRLVGEVYARIHGNAKLRPRRTGTLKWLAYPSGKSRTARIAWMRRHGVRIAHARLEFAGMVERSRKAKAGS